MNMNEKMKNLRLNHKMTLKELANTLGFAENTIHNYESGKRQPDIETIKRYAEIFDVSLNDMLDENSNPVVVFEHWKNKNKIDTLLKKENVESKLDDAFIVFFEPFGDGAIAWGHVEVSLFDGDVDADIKELGFKNNDRDTYLERVIDCICGFDINGEKVSSIFGACTKEDRYEWESIAIEWLDGDWEKDELDENRFRIFR